MKNVLIFMLKFCAGGAERQLIKTAQFLKDSCNVFFVAFSVDGYFKSIVDDEGFSTIIIEKSSIWRTSRRLRSIIKDNNIDLVLSYLPECNIISEIATIPKKNWRVVVGARSSNPDFVNNLKLRLYYHAHHLADAVISNSLANKNDILKVGKLLPSSRIHFIYNMLDPISVEDVYEPFRNGKINMVVAANYRKVKNLMGLLVAISLLSKEERFLIHVDWYGLEIDDSYELGTNFIESQKLESVVSLHPSTNNVLDCYQQADVVGLFSHFEGLPNSLCEALVLGKMVISTPVSDMPEILKGTQNIVCLSSSPKDICNGLRKLIQMQVRIPEVGSTNHDTFIKVFDSCEIKNKLRLALKV